MGGARPLRRLTAPRADRHREEQSDDAWKPLPFGRLGGIGRLLSTKRHGTIPDGQKLYTEIRKNTIILPSAHRLALSGLALGIRPPPDDPNGRGGVVRRWLRPLTRSPALG